MHWPFESWNPHGTLGLHSGKIRLFRPGAKEVFIELFDLPCPMRCIEEAGLFEIEVPESTTLRDYKVWHQNGLKGHDPYAFTPTFGEVDQYLFAKGVHYQAYQVFGARAIEHQDVLGVKFSVWAPAANSVSLVADFNHWDGRATPMRSLGHSGVWEIFIPDGSLGLHYKFEIRTKRGELLIKSDPYGLMFEKRPKTASIVADVDSFEWEDHAWRANRASRALDAKPISIYELHLGSWQREDGQFLNYRELAKRLVNYIKGLGFTHIELMPIMEHPLDESWGYQVTGFFAPTSRFGTPADFQFFVNQMHMNGIGVILDWVPGHFPSDLFSLARFDGTALYEHEDPRQGLHPHWKTLIFNFGRHEVANFLIASALFWLDKMHIDGLRVDAVASMLYLDYGREGGSWIPNRYGGIENLEAIEFLKHLNSVVHRLFPGVLMIAEESTAFPKITHSLDTGGLGFDLKWNMGWMNDTLRYFSKDPFFRYAHQNDLTFGLLYAFSERFCLPLSHDEVVHQKGSLLAKMTGDYWQKFANLRLLISYQWCQPGKKLLFMGAELGQWNEWDSRRDIEWSLLSFPSHGGIKNFMEDLNHFYRVNNALWERDFDYSGFAWVDFSDTKNSVISYLRKSTTQQLFCVHNFTPQHFPDYYIALRDVKIIREGFNSDHVRYGGSGKGTDSPRIADGGVHIQLAPLSTMVFHVQF